MSRERLATDLHWADLHARTLCVHDAVGRLVRANATPGVAAPAPILLFAHTLHGNLWRLRAGLPDPLLRELARLCGSERTPAPRAADTPSPLEALVQPPERWASVEERVQEHVAIEERWNGLAFRFPEASGPSADRGEAEVLPDDALDELAEVFPSLAGSLAGRSPCAVLRSAGAIVSACHAATGPGPGGALEAGVVTLPGHRGHGYARVVVTRFAAEVRRRGGIPLYSTELSNRASRAVADKLGLIPYAAVFQLR